MDSRRMKRIFLVEDDRSIATLFGRVLQISALKCSPN
jgi:hypothetical protein